MKKKSTKICYLQDTFIMKGIQTCFCCFFGGEKKSLSKRQKGEVEREKEGWGGELSTSYISFYE